MTWFRVIQQFDYLDQRGVEAHAEPGKLVDIVNHNDAMQLMSQGLIVSRDLSHLGGKPTPDPAGPFEKTLRIGIWLATSSHYSGGRIHMYQYAWCLAAAGATVYLITDGQPRWMQDYPPQAGLKVLIQGTDPIPLDIDVIITDSKDRFGGLAIGAVKKRPWAPFFCMNFETPNWVEKFVPDYAKKLHQNKAVFKQANHLMANSSESLKYLLEWLGTEKPGHVLQPAINEHALQNAYAEVAPTRPFALFSARGPKYKGCELAAAAVWELDIPFDLVVFGQPRKLPNATNLHRAYPLEGHRDVEKYALMKQAHMALTPSLFEGFGMVPSESLASGTPVISYDLPVLRQEYDGIAGIEFVEWGNQKAFKAAVSEMAHNPKVHVNPKQAIDRFGIRAMGERIERIPHHALRRYRISAQLLGYWGVIPESIESIYDYVDEILVAYGRVPKAPKLEDGSLERIKAFPDPDGKIRIEARDNWRDKKEMRQWCSSNSSGNYCLVLDGDEVWTGLDEWLGAGVCYGSPRWVNLWHGKDYWVYDKEGVPNTTPGAIVGQRWGLHIEPFGSYCPHYRWSWWRPSYYWFHHSMPATRGGEYLYVKNIFERSQVIPALKAAARVPQCVIYHLGHALPEKIMKAKHEFYLARDGRDPSRVQRMKSWHEWDGTRGPCGDGVIASVNWDVPDIVKRAVVSAGKVEAR